MPGREAIDRALPAPGQLFVQRDEQPGFYGGLIIVPESVRLKKRSSMATVVRVSQGIEVLHPGDRVLVNGGVGRRIEFGPRDQDILYVCFPSELLAIVREHDASAVEELGEAPTGRFPISSDLELRADDGATYQRRGAR